MTQKTIIIIILAAILSAVGIIATIQLSRHKEEQKIKLEIQEEKQENSDFWKAQCERHKQSGIKFENDPCDE